MRYMDEITLDNCGWRESVEAKKALIDNGSPCPWIAYSCIYFLEDKLNDSLTMFEYGSGYSSIWFKKRVKSIISVENNEGWVKHLKENDSSLDVHLRPPDMSYVNFIHECNRKFDIIFIDGSSNVLKGEEPGSRVRCAEAAIPCLTPGGIILLDNSDMLPHVCEYIEEQGFRSIGFFGLSPVNSKFHGTTIFYRDNNVFNI